MIYIAVTHYFGDCSEEYEIIGVFQTHQAALHNAMRAEFLANCELTVRSNTRTGVYPERRQAYYAMYQRLLQEAVTDDAFIHQWICARDQFLELYGNFGTVFKVHQKIRRLRLG